MYADFKYYTSSFSGTLIPEGAFPQISKKVSRYLDYITMNRIDEVTDKIKNAVCAGAEALYELHKSYENIPKGIKSENTDGYSVTYSEFDINQFIKQEKSVMYNAFVQELSGTGLLYQGVR